MRVLLSLVCGEDFWETRGVRDVWGGGQRGGGLGGKNRKAELILSWSLFLHTWRHRKEKIHPLLPHAQPPPCRRPLVEAQGSSRCCYRRYPALVRLKLRLKISCWVKSTSVVATVWFKTGYHRYKKKFQIKFGVSLIQTFYRITFFQLIVFCLKLTVKFTPACEGRFFSAYVFTINTFRVGHTFVAVTMSQGNPASRQMFHLDETITLYPVFTLFTSPTCSPLPLNSSPIPIFTQDFAESTLSHLGESDGHIFTVNNKRQKEEKTYEIKKGIIVQKDKNIKNKNLTKRTLMLHDPRPSLPLDSTRRPLTSNHKQEVTLWACSERCRGLWLSGTVEHSPTRCELFFFPPSPVTLVPLWVDSQSKDQECKQDRHGQTRQSVKKTKENAAAALCSLISCFQSADDLFYLATSARVLRPIWQCFFFFFYVLCRICGNLQQRRHSAVKVLQ